MMSFRQKNNPRWTKKMKAKRVVNKQVNKNAQGLYKILTPSRVKTQTENIEQQYQRSQ